MTKAERNLGEFVLALITIIGAFWSGAKLSQWAIATSCTDNGAATINNVAHECRANPSIRIIRGRFGQSTTN
ncbi:hypothetical protein [Thiothrix lacustris]|uniref:hypothetical protein n=1 Tax=Thiothrix lacustris TaxID=525917 RepID=UPI000A9EB695|nr:hypothetical protein [Thiothrix lacustris]